MLDFRATITQKVSTAASETIEESPTGCYGLLMLGCSIRSEAGGIHAQRGQRFVLCDFVGDFRAGPVRIELHDIKTYDLGVLVEINVGQSLLMSEHLVVHLPRLALAGCGQESLGCVQRI
jgi:hypothetical protein